MSIHTPRRASIFKRSRHWTTLACALAVITAAWLLHLDLAAHGALLMLAALVLLPNSSLVRRMGGPRLPFVAPPAARLQPIRVRGNDAGRHPR